MGTKLQEIVASKAQQAIDNANLVVKLQKRKVEVAALIAAKKQIIEEKKRNIVSKKGLDLEKIKTKLREHEISDEQAAALEAQVEADALKDEAALQQEIADLTAEQVGLNSQLDSLGQTNAANWGTIGSTVSVVSGGLLSLITGSQTWLFLMTAIGLAFKAIPPIIKTIAAVDKARLEAQKNGEQQKSLIQMAGAATGLGVPGLIIAAALMAMAGIAAVAFLIGSAINSQKSREDEINDLSKEIFDASKKANTLNNVISKFEALDNKILKTNKDLEEMNSLLDSAADSLDEGEKAEYDSRSTPEGKAEFLREVAEKTRTKLNDKRNELRGKISE